jgi:hypothetical protein
MSNKHETKELLLGLAQIPRTYTELKVGAQITDHTIQNHLSDLQNSGLIQKDKDGRYILTPEGVLQLRIVESNRRSEKNIARMQGVRTKDERIKLTEGEPKFLEELFLDTEKSLLSCLGPLTDLEFLSKKSRFQILLSRQKVKNSIAVHRALGRVNGSLRSCAVYLDSAGKNLLGLDLPSDWSKVRVDFAIDNEDPISQIEKTISYVKTLLSRIDSSTEHSIIKEIVGFARDDIDDAEVALAAIKRPKNE